MAESFVHLHVHTEYSLLDGMSQIDKLVARAAELEMPALSITDHGVMYGAMHFYRACKKAGVKPIIGLEAYQAARTMYDREYDKDARSYHLLLLAKNRTGYQNLLKIASASQLEGFYYKPRIDKDFLAAHSEGLICTSGCLAAEVPRLFANGREDEAKRQIGWFQDVFGKENFFLELQDHNIGELNVLNKWLVEHRDYADVPLVATNDVHYIYADDVEPHDILLCIGTGAKYTESDRMKMGATYHLRTAQEMRHLFGHVPEALTNTLLIAEMCEDPQLESDSYHLPVFPVPEDHDAESYLRHLCEEGLKWRYGSHADDPKVQARLNHELKIIHDMGFDTYFLIVWDLCEFARERDIWWNVRGSGAGSVVAYSLGITNIDPLRNNLIFERFLNPGRVTMPDIDLDYPDDRRQEMIEYTIHKYGKDQVAQIITFGTLGARAAIRDVGRAMDVPLSEVNRVAGLVPNVPGKPVPLMKAIEEVPDLNELYTHDGFIRNLIDTAHKLEGITRHASTHAAGVIVGDKPLVEYLPLHRPTKGGDGEDGVGVTTQFDMETCESIGLLKVDFLGLSTLTIMRKACDLIEQQHGIKYDLDTIPYLHGQEDEEGKRRLDEAFEMLGRGEVVGVFQLEGGGMRRTVMNLQPKRFEHIIAVISLYRPGPMEHIPTYVARMHGKEEVIYLHPKLEPILAETYGIIVYQEQIMQVASELFGYEPGEADLMRRAVSKKKAKALLEHKQRFIDRGPENSVDADTAARIFDDIEFFARYGFNKAHAADYAVITCQTAYLKCHYPVEYMTAILTVEQHNTDKLSMLLEETKRLGIEVLPPDINHSDCDFTIEADCDGKRCIRFGLAAIKNVGGGPVEAILQARGDRPFEDLDDFCRRVDLRQVQRRALECLVKVGALAQFGNRVALLSVVDRMLGASASHHKAMDVGQLSLFGDATGVQLTAEDSILAHLPDMDEVGQREVLAWERELIGVYVTEHPLDSVIAELEEKGYTHTAASIDEADHDKHATMIVMVLAVRPHVTKSGKSMAFVQAEDRTGPVEIVVFPRTWEDTRELWLVDRVLQVRGKIDSKDGTAKILADSATTNFVIPKPNGDAYNGVPTMSQFDLGPLDFDDEPDGGNGKHVYSFDEPDPAYDDDADEPVAAVESEDDYPAEPRSIEAEPAAPPSQAGRTAVEATPAAPAPSSGPHRLLVTMRCTDDEQRNLRRLEQVHGTLTRFDGDDQFAIIIETRTHRVTVDFPKATTRYCDELVQMLQGREGVSVATY